MNHYDSPLGGQNKTLNSSTRQTEKNIPLIVGYDVKGSTDINSWGEDVLDYVVTTDVLA